MQTRQVVAFVTIVAIIALALGTAIGYIVTSGKTSTTTTTQTHTTSVSVTTTLTTVVTSQNRTSQLYEVRFNQSGICNPPKFITPWSVILVTSEDTYNIDAPSNWSSDVPVCCALGTSNRPYSSIVFSVPNGTYSWAINPQFNSVNNLSPQTGNVTISGADVTIILQMRIASCGSTSLSTSSS
jgi:hypothetical protein